MQEQLDKLRETLTRNYEALGWKLERLEILSGKPIEEGTGSPYLLRGMLICPCGGREYFVQALDREELELIRDTDLIAELLLRNTTSRSHLQKDIDDGKLPATFDFDKHCFEKLV